MLGNIFGSLRACVLAALVGLTFIPAHGQAVTLTEDFSDSPFVADGGKFTITGPGTDQFVYQVDNPAFTGDPAGSLVVHYDSAEPTTRFSAPLGVTVTDKDSFSLGAIMTIENEGYAPSPYGYMELAFGLINSLTTGEDRTGDWIDYAADTYDMVEFDYFANASDWFGGPYPTLSVFGLPVSDSLGNFDAFYNFVYSTGEFGKSYPLPLDTPLLIQIDYDGEITTATLKVSEVKSDGSLTELATGVLPINIFDTGNPWVPGLIGGFSVDTISISAYQDGWNSPFLPPSLVATVIYDKLFFTSGAPEITASINIDPDTLNLKSRGNWVTAYLTLPQGYSIEDVLIDTVRLLDTVEAVRGEIQDGTLMLKFSRDDVQNLLPAGENVVTITGELTDGTVFSGSDAIRVISDRR